MATIGDRALGLLPDAEAAPPYPRWFMLKFSLGLVALFCVSAATLLAATALLSVAAGWSPSAIRSNSMAPSIERGDIVVFRPAGSDVVGIGGVIRFENGPGGAQAHRIVDIDFDARSYVTKGDANEAADSGAVRFDQVTGEGVVLVPLLGFPVLWFDDRSVLKLVALVLAAAAVVHLAVEASSMDETGAGDEGSMGVLTAWTLDRGTAGVVGLMGGDGAVPRDRATTS